MAHVNPRSHFDGRAYIRPPRRSRVWAVVKRYELMELFVIITGIVGAWVGATYGSFYLSFYL